MEKVEFRPVILAGGSGTRFWPRSRRRQAKQILALDGERSMIQQTVERLAPLTRPEDVWIITNGLLSGTICEQLKDVHGDHVVCEPAARNTAPAAGLAAFLAEKTSPGAVLGMFPADHAVGDLAAFQAAIRHGIALASAGETIVVLGVRPTRAETGYGYIEAGDRMPGGEMRVRRFTEKPDHQRASEFLAAGNFLWNSGIFLWSARTLANAIREYLPETAPVLEEIAAAFGTPRFERALSELYPRCENISLDYAILEPRSARGERASNLYCVPADFGWNDLGSWAALYEHQLARRSEPNGNVTEASGCLAIEARGNYVYSPGKFVALAGVDNLVVVETEDAILVTTREQSQNVGRIVKELAAARREDLL